MTAAPGDRARRFSATATQKIDHRTDENALSFALQPREAVSHRIESLERSWDIERALQLMAGSFALTGALLSVRRRPWAALPAVVGFFLAQHAVQGWCPPLPILRRLGFRSRQEIDREKFALKALRGDYDDVPPSSTSNKAVRALEVLRAVKM